MASTDSFKGEGTSPSLAVEAAPTASAKVRIDQALRSLHKSADRWARMKPDHCVAILDQLIDGLHRSSARWVAAALEAKGLSAGGQAEGEEWLGMAISLRQLRLLRQVLIDIEHYGHPRLPTPLQRRPNGQIVAQVYPEDAYERMIIAGISAEVWMQPGYGAEETLAEQAWAYRYMPGGRIAAVLGAGNVAFLVIGDFLYQLFVERRVVALKLSPINDYLAPLLSEAFAALIKPGYLQIVHGDADEGHYLITHTLVDTVHMTGSDRTYDTIMFGSGPEGAMRKARGEPLFHKPFTAELGNITPVFVVPGPWSQRDLAIQARALATSAIFNAGFLCSSPRLLIQQRQWHQRDAFLAHYGAIMDTVPARPAYYPGAMDAYAQALAAHPEARRFGQAAPDCLPWTLIPDLDPEAAGEICFEQEFFCSIMAETAIDAPDACDFLAQAVTMANERLWGTLSAAFIVHPATLQDPRTAAAFEEALSALHYGTIVVNGHPGYSYYAMGTPWGAFPGSNKNDIQSGVGTVNNVYMFRRPQKSLLRAPFQPVLSPLNLGSRSMPGVARHLANLQAHRSVPGLIQVVLDVSRNVV
jgi:acyl-CoA reductase-like NAD-dependent aldehyde dehydrogenase